MAVGRANTAFGNIGLWDVSGVTNMSSMFEVATNFNKDIGNWIVSNVTDMNNMFSGATNFNHDITNDLISYQLLRYL